MRQGNKETRKHGFTIIEVIPAIFILTVGVVGVFALVNQSLSSTAHLRSRLIASYLAQEGIEIVRNIRDSNWVEGGGMAWNDGLSGPADFKADYQDTSQSPFSDQFLNIEDGSFGGTLGFYGYSSGAETKFKRKIHLEPFGTDTVEVTVTVSWQEGGINQEFKAKEAIYDWRQ